MIESVETAVAMIGDGAISYGDAEAVTARAARRSLFARRAIARGAVIGRDDLVALRPGTGIPPSELASVVGKKTTTAIPEGYVIRREYLGGGA